jgi:CBS domain-containing protein
MLCSPGIVIGMNKSADPKNIKILFLSADPTDATRLRLGEEKRDIQNELKSSKGRERFVWESRESVRPEDMTQALLDYDPDIIHFSGHGMSTGELCFENPQGKVQPIPPGDLALIFEATESSTECVILNACHSEIQAKEISKYSQFVIGMSKEVGDKSAIAFSVGFYKALGANKKIPAAYKFGRALMKMQGNPEHLIPILYEKTNSSQIQIQKPITYEIVLSGTLSDVSEAILDEAIKQLRDLARENSLTIKEIREGSVIVVLEGSQDSFYLFRDLFRENYLTEVMGLNVSSIVAHNSSNHGNPSNSTQNISNSTKTMSPSAPIYEIFTPSHQLVYVEKSSPFSELYYKMTVLGVPYCLVIDPKTSVCSRIISRIDLLRLVPPGNTLVPPEVQAMAGITVNQSVLLNVISNLEQRNVGELFPDQELIYLHPHDSISRAIELLSTRHRLNGKYNYLDGLPVMGEYHGTIEGYLSYTDILRFLLNRSVSYLEICVADVARMISPDYPLYSLTSSQSLMDAFMKIESLGISAFPVVDKDINDDNLVGFIEDFQVVAYSHPALAEELGKLKISYFMSPLKHLSILNPDELIRDCLYKFLESSSSGFFAPSTLAVVCNKRKESGELVQSIQGLMSYVDILKGWRQFNNEA